MSSQQGKERKFYTSPINRTKASRIENGLKIIEFMTIVRLATALELELSDFFKPSKFS